VAVEPPVQHENERRTDIRRKKLRWYLWCTAGRRRLSEAISHEPRENMTQVLVQHRSRAARQSVFDASAMPFVVFENREAEPRQVV
jgi:hypothetical protein